MSTSWTDYGSAVMVDGPGDRRSTALPLRVLGTITALLLLFLFSGWVGYRAYLATPDVVSVTPPPARHAAMAERAVLFVIDAFTPEKAFDPGVMPTIARLSAGGASGIAQTGRVTTTAPCVYSLTTGRPGSLIQAIFNFHSSETRVDSVLSLVANAGGRLALAGDPAWHRQFGWLIPESDRLESPEPGITTDHHIDAYDSAAVDFILERVKDPRYRLLILHLGSVDAVGHMVTPLSPRYAEQLTFMDGLVARTVAALDPATTLLLVTGDHGMAPRGTHGGEEEARLTPYVLTGPGVRSGVKQNVPQTALTSTLTALLGLPFLPVSEYPPVTALLERSPEEASQLSSEYSAAKRAAAATQSSAGGNAAAALADESVNARLNEVLFGAEESRAGLRLLAGLVTMIGVLGAAFLVWSSTPRRADRPAALPHFVLSAAGPLVLAVTATSFIWMRGAFAFRSTSIATVIVAALLVVAGLVTWVLLRHPRLTANLTSWQVSLFLPVLIVLSAPLVNSHWLRPRPYFEILLLGAVALLVPLAGITRQWARLPAITAAVIYVPQIAVGDWQQPLLPLLSLAVLAMTINNLRGSARGVLAGAVVSATFAAAWVWRSSPGTIAASVVLCLFLTAILLAIVLRRHPVAAAATLIGASTALFLIMASDTHEALVFCAAALVALALSRLRVNLSRPGLVYLLAAVIILLRVCLYFELGDQYNISSIRTAPGFLLADYGLPLVSVVGLLLLKYCLPWLVIIAMALPSLVAVDRRWTIHLFDLLVVGYVVRFAAVGAVIDPFRGLPNGMDGIVGMFCVTWAELLTFGMVAVLAAVLVDSRHGSSAVPVAS
jgi:hypothetical protein